MMRFVFISAFVAVTLASPKPIPKMDGMILCGDDASIEDYPYQVSLLSRGSRICGGSIIGAKWVVTAAHCTDGTSASNLAIRAGSSIGNQGGVVINIAVIHQHPDYDPFTIDYDITVLELASELVFGSGIDSIKLPIKNQIIPIGSSAVYTGWGLFTPANQLQVVILKTVSNSDCNDVYDGAITDRMLCTGAPESGCCHGDSGGPLAVDNVLVGIKSLGYGCGRPGYPGVYANVPNLRQYIENITGM